MNFYLIYAFFGIVVVQQAQTAGLESDNAIISRCLEHINNEASFYAPATLLQQVQNYSSWTVEEIPCFTRCISQFKGWFNVETNSWNKQQIVDDLGADTYNYCRFELDRLLQNACDFAYRGLKCLKQAELNVPLTQAGLLGCVLELHVPLDQLFHYVPLQLGEQVPCLFKCFALKMQLYTPSYEWNISQWESAFGPPYTSMLEVRNECAASDASKKNQDDMCAWMYAEYICLERLSYHNVNANRLNKNHFCNHSD